MDNTEQDDMGIDFASALGDLTLDEIGQAFIIGHEMCDSMWLVTDVTLNRMRDIITQEISARASTGKAT